MKVITILATMLLAQFAWAHGDHKPAPRVLDCTSCTKEQVQKDHVKVFEAVAEKHPDWDASKFKEVLEFNGGKEWKVVFEDKAKPEGQKNLYVFLSKKGVLTGSNTTGK